MFGGVDIDIDLGSIILSPSFSLKAAGSIGTLSWGTPQIQAKFPEEPESSVQKLD